MGPSCFSGPFNFFPFLFCFFRRLQFFLHSCKLFKSCLLCVQFRFRSFRSFKDYILVGSCDKLIRFTQKTFFLCGIGVHHLLAICHFHTIKKNILSFEGSLFS